MIKRLVLFFVLFSLLNSPATQAQSFTILTDTFYINATPAFAMFTDSIVTGRAPVTFMWSVAGSDFPPDWIGAMHYFSICDNSYCYYLSYLWPSGLHDSTFQYAASDMGVLTLVTQLPASATAGCYYLTIKIRNNDSYFGGYESETWIICNDATLTLPENTPGGEQMLYPNPAHDKLYVHGGAAAANVAIYNVLGAQVKTTSCTNGDATILINDLPAGIYIARTIDASGTIVATNKFSKE